MTISVASWPIPALTRAGQETFWDRQSGIYDSADMTQDNAGELAIVRRLCEEYATSGCALEDIVTLGGATGCRDPVVITEALGQEPQEIFFNDLSSRMVDAALAGSLARYRQGSTAVTAVAGPIHEVTRSIRAMPRRVIIGVYSVHGFVEANPAADYPLPGLEEYVRNAHILGDRFSIESLAIENGIQESYGVPLLVSGDAAPTEVARALALLRQAGSVGQLGAFRIIGQHTDVPGFFLSHWYTRAGILAMLHACFPPDKASISLYECAKGFVACIDPVLPARGIVTVLNNVVGNVLTHEQAETLAAISRMSC